MSSSTSTSCATCASLLTGDPSDFDMVSEKPVRNRTFNCCGRVVCSSCIAMKPHLASYCLYCQTTRLPSLHREDCQILSINSSTADTINPSTPPPAEPPPYTPFPEKTAVTTSHTRSTRYLLTQEMGSAVSSPLPPPPGAPVLSHATLPTPNHPPPSYAERQYTTPPPEVDVIHHLHPNETLLSVSLAYNVPLAVLRAYNNITSDNLVYGRRMLSIPYSHYKGPSKRSEPVGGYEESERKARIRRFMVRTKCKEWSEAERYVEDADGDVEMACKKWSEDEEWEKNNPLVKGKGKGRALGSLGNDHLS